VIDCYRIVWTFDLRYYKQTEHTALGRASAEHWGRLETLDEIRTYFEGKEAIYIEKGALRVRVSNIRYADLEGEAEFIEAEIEEIPTPGLPVSLPGYDRREQPRPLRWRIGRPDFLRINLPALATIRSRVTTDTISAKALEPS
jgi:hypothetical protein